MSTHKTARIDSSELFFNRQLFVNQRIEHGLCLLWQHNEQIIQGNSEENSSLQIRDFLRKEVDTELFEDLVKMKYIKLDGNSARLSDQGKLIAKDLIRRRRLAERLLQDVLDVSRSEVESQACEFEHIIDKNVEESICTLLGHPRECPHGLPIPTGDCCTQANSVVESIVSPLSHYHAGEKGKVAYILTRDHPELHKLMSLGIVPGTVVHIHQTSPSYIIKVEETQLAMEKDVAKNIYLRKIST